MPDKTELCIRCQEVHTNDKKYILDDWDRLCDWCIYEFETAGRIARYSIKGKG